MIGSFRSMSSTISRRLACLGGGERGQAAVSASLGRVRVSVHDAHSPAPARVHCDQPIAFGHMKIGAQLILAGVDRAAVLAVFAAGDDQQRLLVE